MITRIYINKHKIRANKKIGSREAPITIRTYKGTEYATKIELYDGYKPLLSVVLSPVRLLSLDTWPLEHLQTN